MTVIDVVATEAWLPTTTTQQRLRTVYSYTQNIRKFSTGEQSDIVDPGCKRRAERDATKRAHLKIEKSVLGTSDFADFTEYKHKNKTPRTKNSEKSRNIISLTGTYI